MKFRLNLNLNLDKEPTLPVCMKLLLVVMAVTILSVSFVMWELNMFHIRFVLVCAIGIIACSIEKNKS